MLITIREKFTGWIGWALLILIGLAFSLFGLRYYLQGDARVYAAKVNDVEISRPELSRAYERRRQQIRQNLGDDYDPRLFDERAVRRSALEQMIAAEVLVQAAQNAGFKATDAMVATQIQLMPVFQEDGRFSPSLYDSRLRLKGLSHTEFESDLRRTMILDQLFSGISGTGLVMSSELDKILRIQDQERKLDYLPLPLGSVRDQVNVSEEEIGLHYEKFRRNYLEPEQVKLEYVILNVDELGADVVISEGEIAQLYEESINQFGSPEERRARHILIAVPGDADETAMAEAQAKVEAVQKGLRDGQSFEDLAKKFSDDPGSKIQGGDLGYFSKGAMVAAFEKEVFAQKIGDISAPVRTEFGFHIIELTDIRSASVKSLDEVRSQLVEEEKRRRSIEMMYDELENLANLAFEHPDSLQVVSEISGLPIQETDWFARQGGDGIAAEPAVLDAAFSGDVLLDGNNSEPLELDGNRIVVVRVKEHKESHLKPLQSVRDEIIQSLEKEMARSIIQKLGLVTLQRLQDGESMESVSTELGLILNSAGFIRRDTEAVNALIVRKTFQVPAPAEGVYSYGGVELESGDYVVLRVSAVKEGSPESSPKERTEELRRQYMRLQEIYERDALSGFLSAEADIDVAEDP